MTSQSSVLSDLRLIFHSGLNSVKPSTIFHQKECLKVTDNKLKVQDDEFNIKNKKIHIIGFGKAVGGLSIEIENVLKLRLVSGIISVPIGSATLLHDVSKNSVIKVVEGAKDNFPDENSFTASKEIVAKCKEMTDDDILLCLISGGGSALLPYPSPPITLKEKTEIIKTLSKKGATIDELNTVRIALSETKGGKLAVAAKNCHKIISLIMSDIVNDPLDLIASGPTVAHINSGSTGNPLDIVKKFGLYDSLSRATLDVIESYQPVPELSNVKNYIIASNEIAIKNAMEQARTLGYEPVFLSKSITGDVKDVSRLFEAITNFLLHKTSNNNELNSNPDLLGALKNALESSSSKLKGICVISGGEPVVKVVGNGIGGRNQELALRFGHFCTLHNISNAYLLSAGTDGIDGPGNDAAGAIGTKYDQKKEVMDAFLADNNSYNFFKEHSLAHHVITGHTGTNVMDLQILIVVPNDKNSSKL